MKKNIINPRNHLLCKAFVCPDIRTICNNRPQNPMVGDIIQTGVAHTFHPPCFTLPAGFDKLSSDVSKTARPFFETKGFKVIRENKNMMNDVEIINYHMSQ